MEFIILSVIRGHSIRLKSFPMSFVLTFPFYLYLSDMICIDGVCTKAESVNVLLMKSVDSYTHFLVLFLWTDLKSYAYLCVL
jgi:hypothetical protein